MDTRLKTLVAEQAIRRDAKAQLLGIEALSIGTSELIVYYSNKRYDVEDDAAGRLVRILMADAPARIEVFYLVPVVFGQPMHEIRVLRSPLERVFATRGSIDDIPQAFALRPAPLHDPVLAAAQRRSYPRLSWSLSPAFRQGLLDKHAPLRIDLYAKIAGSLEVLPGLFMNAQYDVSLYNSFSRATAAPSSLPHVRTDLAKYVTKGRYGFSYLDVAYRTRLAPDLFAEFKAGYLEDMFAGAGAQILWRPEGSRWVLGADLYQVWKRDYDRLFGLQNYNVLTGHVSVYYHSPWYGLQFGVHAGRYLAGDYGATFEVSRRFLTNVEVGAYATFTDVPFSKFGPGSFDKGIFIRIPLEWALPLSSQSEYRLTLSSLIRDGGQRLVGDDSLYDETRRTGFNDLMDHRSQIVVP